MHQGQLIKQRQKQQRQPGAAEGNDAGQQRPPGAVVGSEEQQAPAAKEGEDPVRVLGGRLQGAMRLGLPPPLVPGNYEAEGSRCFLNEDVKVRGEVCVECEYVTRLHPNGHVIAVAPSCCRCNSATVTRPLSHFRP